MFEMSSVPMIVTSADGCIQAANPASRQLFGYRLGELLGHSIDMLFEGELAGSLRFACRGTSESFDPDTAHHRLEIEGRHRRGDVLPIDLTVTPLRGSQEPLILCVMLQSTSAVASTMVSTAYRIAAQDMASFQRDLLMEMARGHGLGGIASALHRKTGHKVLVLDSSGRILTSAGYRESAPVPRDRIVVGHLSSLHGVRERHGDCWTAAACPDQTLLGWIGILDPAGTLPEFDLLALEQAVSVLTAELLRNRGNPDTEPCSHAQFANELLDGCDGRRMHTYATALGYDLNRAHRAIAVESGVSSEVAVESVERAARANGVRSPLVAWRSDRAILVAPVELSSEQFVESLTAALGTTARIGIGSTCPIEAVGQSLTEALFTLELGSTVDCDQPVTSFGDLGVWKILVDSSDPQELHAFVTEWIGTLIEYDGVHGTELVKTLTVYLKGSCAVEAAATALYVHRNTLRYRLTKIAQLIGRDIGDADQRFQLELACRAWMVLQALESP